MTVRSIHAAPRSEGEAPDAAATEAYSEYAAGSRRGGQRSHATLIGVACVAAVLLLAVITSVVDAGQYAWLGVRIRDMSEQEMDEVSSRHGIREGFGVFIVEVMDATPAARAGMKTGDIVVAVDGRPVTESRLLQRLIAAAPIGRGVPVTVLRENGRQRLDVRLAPMPKPVVGERIAAEFGFALRDLEGPAARGESALSGAPAISAVMRGSPAERGGLEVGDVLLEVNERPVMTRDAAREALADVAPDSPLKLSVRRGGRRVPVTLSAR
ncbi:MAG: PDZ domain-containing protein [Candidatus Rokubacteria bacterium]|nr:PDZ domain-containing protein [Candidatus Rokubacteria bacterium]